LSSKGQEKASRLALRKSEALDLALVTTLPDGGAVFVKWMPLSRRGIIV